MLTTLPILWLHLVPLITGTAWPHHRDHDLTLAIHATGGTAMLLLGAAGLFVGWTRRGFRYHKLIGYSYLALGSVGALGALALSLRAPHEPRSLYVATGTLAAFWLAVAAMAWRAAHNRRFEPHREWMIRSYVLSWTFIGCRLADWTPWFPGLGPEGVTASIWINWIVPLFLCEVALQWRKTGKAH